jgi:hypothetical protein
MKKKITRLFLPLCVLFTTLVFAQSQKETAEKAVSEYFKLERENIHVQLDKAVFTTNEQVWFKGYVFHRKKNLPFFTTVNVMASLMDETGKVIETQLLYAYIGTFSGSFKLNDKMASGRYYIQFYTNWMNNFTEDESFVSSLTVINQAKGAGNALSPADPSKLNIAINPEGGSFLAGVTNIVGIHVTDCNNESAGITTADVADQTGTVLKKLQLNKLGYGRFDIIPKAGDTYKIVVNTENGKHEMAFPPVKTTGITMEVNNFTAADKTLITVRTNSTSAAAYKSLMVLVHKDDKHNIYDLKPKGNETTIAIANADLADGVNTVRLLDENLNELAERLIYKYPTETLATSLTKESQKIGTDAAEYKGKVSKQGMYNLSVSILPENSLCIDEDNDIYSSLWLLPYVENQKNARGKHYFSTLTRGKAYELDVYLLNQKSKYAWQNIKGTPATDKYGFDRGVTLKGTVPEKLINSNAKVRLYSITGLDETTSMDSKGSFAFDNLIITDSLHISLTVINKGLQPRELSLKPLITNGIKPYNKMYKPVPRCYLPGAALKDGLTGTLPQFVSGSITLEETVIEKTRLKYARSLGNNNLQGHKITESDGNIYRNVTQYIVSKGGFRVEQTGVGGDVHIYSRGGRVSINAAQSEPIIYVNNMQLTDHNQLNLYYMDQIDEIYMNPTAIVPSLRNFSGIIKIYLKPYIKKKAATNSTPDIFVSGAFERNQPFKNVTYMSTVDKGFENFGVIDWNAQIMTGENGEFNLSVPRLGQKNIKLLIEGFSADGALISEIKTLTE